MPVYTLKALPCKYQYMSKQVMSNEKLITLSDRHEEVIEELREEPGGFNFSQYVRKKLEEDFPNKFD